MKNTILFISFIISSFSTCAQVASDSDLYKTILEKDSLLFNVGFNNCDISQFENLLSDHLQFYHDKDGISNKAKFLADLKNGICNYPTVILIYQIDTRISSTNMVGYTIQVKPFIKK